jgi:hypothetical protein
MQLKNHLSIPLLMVISFSPAAHAWPLGRLFHWHPATAAVRDSGINFQLSNRSGLVQEVEVSGKHYTLMPNSTTAITAMSGTPVISQSSGEGREQTLFAVQPTLRNKTVTLH